MNKGLFETWLAIELGEGKPLKQVLDEINNECGTAYKHNWPAKMASRGYAMERIPDCVRRYMLRKVLPARLAKCALSKRAIEILIISLT